MFTTSITELEVGDEIGLFDLSGVTESCIPEEGCEDAVVGETLVGSGVWAWHSLM